MGGVPVAMTRSSPPRRRGQALVELALLLPFLMVLVLGVLEMGRAWNAKQVLTDAAREGARLAVVGDPSITDTSQVNPLIRRILGRAGFDSTQVTISYPDGFKTGTGNITSVQLSMPFRFVALHRLAGLVTSNGLITLRTTARMRNE
jgi:Flp pilus assembly protein TadG